MSLLAIGLLTIAALASWGFRSRRRDVLLLISVIAIYALQPDGLRTALPTVTILLVIGVWWIITPAPSANDYRMLAVLGVVVGICMIGLPLAQSVKRYELDPTWQGAFVLDSSWMTLAGRSLAMVVPSLAALTVATVSIGAIFPRDDEGTRRRVAVVFIILVIVLLVILKLPALQIAATSLLARSLNQPIYPDLQWLGFSYIAFRLMHVLLDYRNRRVPAVSLGDFALYIIFFPAIPAGPIDRVEHFTRELDAPKSLDATRITDGFIRIGVGLFKKFILADTLAYISLSPALIDQARQSAPVLIWVMVYAYAFRLYFDFAGYTDIAIGIGILAGIKLPENFTSPYTKRNITAFWNSWHITLATWFRNYIFTPLSRRLMGTELRNHRLTIILIAQLTTMVLIGLWHGIALNFVLWGAWHGVGLWLHKWWTDHSRGWDEYVQARPRLTRAVDIGSLLLTFHFVAIGWIFFALPTLDLIGKTFAGLVGFYGR